MTNKREIKVHYSSVDRYSKTAKFKTLEGARKFAHRYVGEHPDMGGSYAVSYDGIGTIRVEGATLQELFPGDDEEGTGADYWAAMSEDELAEALEEESEAIHWQNVDRATRATCGWSPDVDRAASRELARRNALRPACPVPAPVVEPSPFGADDICF